MRIDRVNKLQSSVASLKRTESDNTGVLARIDRLDESGLQPNSPEHQAALSDIEKKLQDREYIMIPIDLVDDSPYGARQNYINEIIDARAASIAALGQLDAIKVTKRGDRWILIDGGYRKRAIERLNRKEIMARDLGEMDDASLYKLSFVSNNDRDDHSCLDNAIVWNKLINDKVFESLDEIAATVGFSKPWVHKIMGIIDMSQACLDKIQSNPDKFSQSVAYEVSAYFKESKEDEAATLKVIDKIINDGISKRDVEHLRKKLNSTKVRTHEMSRQYKIKDMPGIKGSLKNWDSGRMVLDVEIKDPATKDRLMDAIRAHLNLNV